MKNSLKKIYKIDTESTVKILGKYPLWKQLNLANRISVSDTNEAFAEMQEFIRNILDEADTNKREIRASVIDKSSEE